MRFVQSLGDLHPVAQRLLQREWPLEQPVGQRLAFQVLHDQVLGVAFAAHVVQRADVWMRELRDRLRLPLETLADLGRGGKMRRQDLDRHRPVESGVPRPVHLSHAARAERRDDLVGPEAGAGGEGHFRPSPRKSCPVTRRTR